MIAEYHQPGPSIRGICPNPVFIIGSPRSGTSILAWALAQHSRLWTSGEVHILHSLLCQFRFDRGYFIRQRVRQGKSGGYRTVVAFRRGERAVFLFGFAKNERANIDGDELDEFKRLARGYLDISAKQIALLIDDNELMEVSDGERD